MVQAVGLVIVILYTVIAAKFVGNILWPRN